jgi:hypothetical protein
MVESQVLDRGLKGRKRVYDDIDALQGSRAVRKWLEGMRAGPHRKTALYNLARYLRWRRARALEADPDRLVEECLNGNNQTLIRHLDALVEYCQGGTFQGSSLETRRKNFKDAVSFYRAHYVTLPKARINGEGERAVRTEVTASGFLAFVKTVLLKARLTPKPRAVILTMLQSGMDASTLSQVFNVYAYPQLVSHFGTEFEKWDVGRCPVRVDLLRPKIQYKYYTFLDVDAVDALKDWLRKRQLTTGGPIRIHGPKGPSELPTSDPVFIRQGGGSITPAGVGAIFRQAGKKAGVNIPPAGKQWGFRGAANRYPFHSHEVRDTLVTPALDALLLTAVRRGLEVGRAEAATVFSHLNFVKNSGELKAWLIAIDEAHRYSSDANLRALLIEARKFTRKVLLITTDWRVYEGICRVYKPVPW